MSANYLPKDQFNKHGCAIFNEVVSKTIVQELLDKSSQIPNIGYKNEQPFWSFLYVSGCRDVFKKIALKGYFPKLAAYLIGVKQVHLLFDQMYG